MSKLIPSTCRGKLCALLTLLIAFAALAYFHGDTTLAQESQTEEQTDEGPPVGQDDEGGEDPNSDECEEDPNGKNGSKRGDCVSELLDEVAGSGGSAGHAGDGPGPAPGDGDPGSPRAEEPAGENSSGDKDGKEQQDGNGTSEIQPDPQGEGKDIGEDSGAPSEDGPEPAGSEGSDGGSGGPKEGDGEGDPKGGGADGEANENCQSAGASAQTPPPVNQKPVGGSTGANPGFLNPPVVFRYRSNDPTDGVVGTGWDANVFERVIVNPTRNPAGQLQSISSSYGHPNMWTFDYHSTGRLKSATDFSGRKTTIGYDATRHLAAIAFPATATHPNGKKFQFGYHAGTGNPAVDGKMMAIHDPMGNTRVEFEYDPQGLVHKVRRGNGLHELTITRTGPTTRDIVDFNGNTRRYTFQAGLPPVSA